MDKLITPLGPVNARGFPGQGLHGPPVIRWSPGRVLVGWPHDRCVDNVLFP